MSTTHAKSAAANIRAELARRGLTQSDVAPHLGLTRQAVSRRLVGPTPFTLDQLYKIAELVGVPISVLIEPAGDEAPVQPAV